jgi:cytochrome c peroxidase
VTRPYFHDGRSDDLQDAVRQHGHGQASTGVHDLNPSPAQAVADLTAFVATLTDHHGARRPWTSLAMYDCP